MKTFFVNIKFLSKSKSHLKILLKDLFEVLNVGSHSQKTAVSEAAGGGSTVCSVEVEGTTVESSGAALSPPAPSTSTG